jgi:hypothetical protein
MPGILDIAPPEIVTERFDIRGGYLEVRALRNREWAMLARRFPDVIRDGGLTLGDDLAPETIDRIDALMPAVIAAACGTCGDEKIEAAIVDRLTEAERTTVFNAVMRLTNTPAPLAGSPVVAGQVANGQAETNTPPALSS